MHFIGCVCYKNVEQLLIESKKNEASVFIRKKSLSVDLQESPVGVWSSLINKAEQFFGLNDSDESDEDTSNGWEDAADDDLNNISIFAHEVMEPPPPDSYCVAKFKYDGKCEDELSLLPGDILKPLREVEPGWWAALIGDQYSFITAC